LDNLSLSQKAFSQPLEEEIQGDFVHKSFSFSFFPRTVMIKKVPVNE
jgi:hypothetical protein